MRILIVGAGATGGYFGGRLLEAGRDVTFLVRPARAARLAETGLVILSRYGDLTLPSPPTVLAGQALEPFDLILLSCKAYDLDSAIDAFAPAVGPGTVIVPLLNGLRHLDVLDERLGADHVLGGVCIISSRLDPTGRIVHLSDLHRLTFGERSGVRTPRVETLTETLCGAGFECRPSDAILLDMWEKWVFLATLGGINCLMRAAVGDIVAVGASDLSLALLEECRSVADAAGWPPRQAFLESARGRLTEATSTLAASLLSDVERGGRTEADHILGDLLRRRGGAGPRDQSLLRLAYAATKAAEARVARESSSKLTSS